MPEIISNAGMTDEERVILALHVAASADGGTPGSFLDMLAYAVADRTWEKRGVSFRAMLETPPPRGAGVTADDTLHLIQFTHPHERNNQAKHKELEAMRQVVRKELHEALAEHGEIGNGRSRPDNIRSTDYGTSEDYSLRRLRRDRPELADKVIAGEIKSTNAAMIEAGLRPKRTAIRLDDPKSASDTIAKATDRTYIEALIRALQDTLELDDASQ